MAKLRYACLASLLLLTACAGSGTVHLLSPDTRISGVLQRDAAEPYRLEVRLDGKRYHGEWRSEPLSPQQRQEVSLPHRKHVAQVRATLQAEDGEQLACQWLTHGQTASGHCALAGQVYPLNLN